MVLVASSAWMFIAFVTPFFQFLWRKDHTEIILVEYRAVLKNIIVC